MANNIIKLTEEHAARTEEAARVASKTGATAGAIFERRDPVRLSRCNRRSSRCSRRS
jgi:hypothetical protein